MTSIETPKLIIPIQAEHVRTALATAREDQEAFRKSEMSWLEANNPFLRAYVARLFEKMIKINGIANGEALMAGNMLGNHAVRLCLDDPGDYERAKENYLQNLESDHINLNRPGPPPSLQPWNTEDTLLQVFGDENLVAALLEIKHDTARDSAAVTIGFYGLLEIPEIAPDTVTS